MPDETIHPETEETTVTTTVPTHVELLPQGITAAINGRPITTATTRLMTALDRYVTHDSPWEYAALVHLLAGGATDTAAEGEKPGYLLETVIPGLPDKVWFTPNDRGGWTAMFASDW